METKRILVYGDSIPWGMIPATKFDRYPYDERWPGILQEKLGQEYQIIEECLCARTIDSDDLRPGFEGRNGMTYLPACLDSQSPVDIVILSLGLNEIKSIFDWTPVQVAEKMGKMIDLIHNRKSNFHERSIRVMLLSQPIVESTGFWGDLWVGSHDKSVELVEEYRKLAEKMGVDFIELTGIEPFEADGVHLDAENHARIAEKVFEHLKKGGA